MSVNERNAALNAATIQLADVCRTCGEPATATYPVLGGLDVGFCDAHDDNNGEGFYAIIGAGNFAQPRAYDIPGAGGKWYPTRGEAQAACDAWNAKHAERPFDDTDTDGFYALPADDGIEVRRNADDEVIGYLPTRATGDVDTDDPAAVMASRHFRVVDEDGDVI